MKVGDDVVTKQPLWHDGEDLGNKLGRVVDTDSYIMVNLHGYHSNPVKCFRNDLEVVIREKSMMEEWYEENLDDWGVED